MIFLNIKKKKARSREQSNFVGSVHLAQFGKSADDTIQQFCRRRRSQVSFIKEKGNWRPVALLAECTTAQPSRPRAKPAHLSPLPHRIPTGRATRLRCARRARRRRRRPTAGLGSGVAGGASSPAGLEGVGGGGRPGGGDGRWAEAEVAERPPERAVGDGRWAAGAAGARNESG